MSRKKPPLFTPRPVAFRFESQCQDKVRFKGREAQAVAEKYGQRVYRCVHCGGRHLTSTAAGEEGKQG